MITGLLLFLDDYIFVETKYDERTKLVAHIIFSELKNIGYKFHSDDQFELEIILMRLKDAKRATCESCRLANGMKYYGISGDDFGFTLFPDEDGELTIVHLD